MNRSRRAKWLALLVALGAGTAFQVGTNGCAQYYATSSLNALDFCAVFNCQGGSFFNLCEPVPLFVDCPNTTTTTSP